MTIISVDLDYTKPPITARTSDADYLRGVIADALDSWMVQYNAPNRDAALTAAADAARPDTGGTVGIPLQIRARQAELIRTGGFPVGTAPVRWLPGGEAMKSYLFGLLQSSAAEITAAPPIKALDGTNFPISTLARVQSLCNALDRQERLITQAANQAIQSYRAAVAAEPPQPFSVSAIVWPPVYVPA